MQPGGFGEIPNAETIEPDRATRRWDARFEELFRILPPICSLPQRRTPSFCAIQSPGEAKARTTRCRRCIQQRCAKKSKIHNLLPEQLVQRYASRDKVAPDAMHERALAAMKLLPGKEKYGSGPQTKLPLAPSDSSTIELFNLVTFQPFLTFKHANHCYRLSRRYFILVFLVRVYLGGIEKAL